MLHLLLAVVLLSTGGSGVAVSQDKISRTLDVTTQESLRALHTQLKQRIVHIRRERTRIGALTYPGGRVEIGLGWLTPTGEIYTASALVESWNPSVEDRLQVTVGATIYEVSDVIIDVRAGGAILRVNGQLNLPVGSVKWVPPSDDELWVGRALFTAGSDSIAHRVVVAGRGRPPFQYFFQAPGTYPLGAPFTDAQGRLLTIVGGRHFEHARTMYLTPPDGMRWFTESDRQSRGNR